MNGKRILRILLAAVAITAFAFIFGWITCGCLFRSMYEIEPTNIWKSMTAPPGALFYVGSFVMNIIFVVVYMLLRKGVSGKNVVLKGLVYGLCVWAVGQLPGMFSMYVFMTVAWQVLLYWTVLGLIELPLDGIIAALICGKE